MGAPQTPKFISQLLLKTDPPMGVFLYQKNKKIQTKKRGNSSLNLFLLISLICWWIRFENLQKKHQIFWQVGPTLSFKKFSQKLHLVDLTDLSEPPNFLREPWGSSFPFFVGIFFKKHLRFFFGFKPFITRSKIIFQV